MIYVAVPSTCWEGSMTDLHRLRRPTRPRSARRVLAATLAGAALVGGAACADSADSGGESSSDVEAVGGFEASTSFLRAAADQSTSEGYRTEMRFALGDEVDFGAEPLMSSVIDGDRYHMTMDMASMYDQMAAQSSESVPQELTGIDLSMEMAGDPETLYLRAPMFAALADMVPAGQLGPLGAMGELGDGWGYVDLTALGEQLPSDVASALGGQAVDPRALVETVEGADDVQDLGADEIDGEQVRGLSADVSLGELLEAVGQDPDTFAETIGVMGTEEAVAAVYEVSTPIEVWIDEDGYLRRWVYGYSLAEIAEAMDVSAGPGGDMEFNFAVDMFDYGATVEFTAPADAVDLTDAYAGLIQS
jgi:hypothetical protein